MAAQVVSLRRCHLVTDVGVASIASAGQLRVLNLNKLHRLGVLAVKALIATCRWGTLPLRRLKRNCSTSMKH